MKNKTVCLVPDCFKDSHIRGLCLTHYSTARHLVKTKRVTWKELETSGRALRPPKYRMTKAIGFFLGSTAQAEPVELTEEEMEETEV